MGRGAEREWEEAGVIKLTRISGEEFVVNSELIQYVERRGDTFVTLTTQERLVVRESLDEVIRRAVEYSRSVRMMGRG